MIRHIFSGRFLETAPEDKREEIIDAMRDMEANIPGIALLTIGTEFFDRSNFIAMQYETDE